jgi:hypothetical protein
MGTSVSSLTSVCKRITSNGFFVNYQTAPASSFFFNFAKVTEETVTGNFTLVATIGNRKSELGGNQKSEVFLAQSVIGN